MKSKQNSLGMIALAGFLVLTGGLLNRQFKALDLAKAALIAEATPTANKSSIKLVSSHAFHQLRQDPHTFVIDVHTPEQTHIPGTDAVIAYDKLEEAAALLPRDKTTPIVVYCRSGNMSAEAAQTLTKMGYTTIYDLAGGSNRYKEAQVQAALWPETHDLGTVVYGEVATTTFTLTNYTPLPLRVTRVASSCECTKATVTQMTLEPYSATTVQVSFDPAVHKDDTDWGNITRTIYIDTDNPNFPHLQSTITAKVITR